MAKEPINRPFGYLRETSKKATGHDACTGLNRTGLDQYLAVIFPGVSFIHDKAMGGDDPKVSKKRPDYRNEELKLIIEFDGLQHYTNPERIMKDEHNTQMYRELGYKVVRIPYFIQLTNDVVLQLFGVKVDVPLFDGTFPSLTIGCAPAVLCPLGLERMAKEFCAFPEQYKTNIEYLKSWAPEDSYRNGYEFLEREYERVKRLSMPNLSSF